MLLKDKVCIVTGCNRGIGLSILKAFAGEGAIVFANSRKEGSLEETVKELEDQNDCKIFPVYFDVNDSAEIKKLIMRIKKEYDRLDVLVNNAGIMKDALIGMISREMMREIFETNVFASMDMMQFSTKLMKKQGSGSIINFSSIVGVYGNEGQAVYSASKGAVIAMTKTAAKELAPYNIRVNAVAPGMIDTDMFRSIGEEKMERHLSNIGMGRLGMPEDIAKVCVMLASDYTSYMTGQIVGIDGSAVV